MAAPVKKVTASGRGAAEKPAAEQVVYPPKPVQGTVDIDERIRDAMRRIEKTRTYLAHH